MKGARRQSFFWDVDSDDDQLKIGVKKRKEKNFTDKLQTNSKAEMKVSCLLKGQREDCTKKFQHLHSRTLQSIKVIQNLQTISKIVNFQRK